MRVSSPAFGNTQYIPSRYTCDGKDINPPLTIEDIPQETKSLALIVDDIDSPSGVFTHWVIWNIEPTKKEIKENSIPSGASQGTNSFDKQEYGGPCPRSGTHRYFFKAFALNIRLELPRKKSKTELEDAMRGHIIEQDEIMGIYSKYGNKGSKRDRMIGAASRYPNEPIAKHRKGQRR